MRQSGQDTIPGYISGSLFSIFSSCPIASTNVYTCIYSDGQQLHKVSHHSYCTNECVLEVKNLSRGNVVKNASFKVHKGEVLGISGLVGAGRTELFRLIAGLDKPTSGSILVNGKNLPLYSVKQSIAHGIGLVPEDRKKDGILKQRAISVNIAMPDMKRYTKFGLIRRSFLKNISLDFMKELNLRPLNVDRTIGTLSGGNQQKVIIGRWLASGTQIFLFDEPTRGIDDEAKSEIYQVIEDLAKQGKVVLVISSEMTEIMRVSDRVLVMREGEIVANLEHDDINEDNLAKYAIGQNKQVA